MTAQQGTSRTVNILLWTAQIILAASLVWSGAMKLFQPVEKMAEMWPWAGEVQPAFLKFTGIVDLLGAAGLILPGLLRMNPKLTGIAAIGVILLMVAAAVFHVVRGEASSIGVNIVFAVIAGGIVWGRMRRG